MNDLLELLKFLALLALFGTLITWPAWLPRLRSRPPTDLARSIDRATATIQADAVTDEDWTFRRRFRNSRDPSFQGDGWRWSLSFELPFPLDLLVLTSDQRDAYYRERVAFLDFISRPMEAAPAKDQTD